MKKKICEHNNLKILKKSNVLQTDYNGYPVRLCICKCEDCGHTDQFWLEESLEKAKEELENGTSVLLEWNYEEKQKGWICPRCNKVHAPSVKECDCDYIFYNAHQSFNLKDNNNCICVKGEYHKYVLEKEVRISKSDSLMYYKCEKCGHIKVIHKQFIN